MASQNQRDKTTLSIQGRLTLSVISVQKSPIRIDWCIIQNSVILSFSMCANNGKRLLKIICSHLGKSCLPSSFLSRHIYWRICLTVHWEGILCECSISLKLSYFRAFHDVEQSCSKSQTPVQSRRGASWKISAPFWNIIRTIFWEWWVLIKCICYICFLKHFAACRYWIKGEPPRRI